MPEPGATRFIWRRNVRSEKAWLPANTTRATLMRGPSWISYLATAAAVGVSSNHNRPLAWGWAGPLGLAVRTCWETSQKNGNGMNFCADRIEPAQPVERAHVVCNPRRIEQLAFSGSDARPQRGGGNPAHPGKFDPKDYVLAISWFLTARSVPAAQTTPTSFHSVGIRSGRSSPANVFSFSLCTC